MPPKRKHCRDEFVNATLNFWRNHPFEKWNARSLAAEMGISTQPIFSAFSSMEELKEEAMAAVNALFRKRVEEEINSGKWPEYKAVGIAYVGFAKQEPRLFSLMCLREQDPASKKAQEMLLEETLAGIQKLLGLKREEAWKLHLAVWGCTHGLATMLATGFCPLAEDVVSDTISLVYQSILKGEHYDSCH